MTLRVRPFDPEVVEFVGTVRGEIANGQYALVFPAATYELPTLSVGTDELGSFADLEECERDLGLGLLLRIEADYSELEGRPGEPHCCVSLTHDRPRTDYENAAEMAGFALSEVNVVLPPSWAISLYFGPGGTFDGYGAIEPPASQSPSRAH